MIPTYSNLAQCVGRRVTWEIGAARAREPAPAQELSIPISLEAEDDEFVLTSRGSDGLWIPYLERTATYAYVSAGVHWAASGPFSGCHFEIGVNGGRIYVAHIAIEEHFDATASLGDALPERQSIRTFMPTGIKLGALLGEGFEGLVFAVWDGEGRLDVVNSPTTLWTRVSAS